VLEEAGSLAALAAAEEGDCERQRVDYLAAAVQAAEFLRRELWDESPECSGARIAKGGETCPALPGLCVPDSGFARPL